MSLVQNLENLKKERTEGSPFYTLLAFEKWSDRVSPLLDFDKRLQHKFNGHVSMAQIAAKLRDNDVVAGAIGINQAIGVLNQAIPLAEKYEEQQSKIKATKSFAPDEDTIGSYLNRVKIKDLSKLVGLAVFMFTLGVTSAELGIYENIPKPRFLDKGSPKATGPKEKTDNTRAVGALVLGCDNQKPAMLGVLQDVKGHLVFSPPGGHVQPDERNDDTVIREVKEETGYIIIPTKPLGTAPKGDRNFSMVLAEIDNRSPTQLEYHVLAGILWADPTNIPMSSWRFPEQREWILDLFRNNISENVSQSCKDS